MRLFSQFFPYTAMALGEAGDAPSGVVRRSERSGDRRAAMLAVCREGNGG